MSDPKVVHDVSSEPATAGYPAAPRTPGQGRDARGSSDNKIGARSSDPKAGQFVAKGAVPAVPGNDAAVSGFEGFANKEAGKGDPIFPAKNEPQAAPGNGSLPPGATETSGYPTSNKVTAKTTDSFLKSIGD